MLTSNGVRISEVASFSDDELRNAVLEINDEDTLNKRRVNDLIVVMSDFNEAKFHKLFDEYIAELGFEKTFIQIIHPYLEKVGILWLSGEIQATQEHLITSLIRSKLIMEIESMKFPFDSDRSAILFLPEGEFHELGLLFFNYLLRKKGIKVYYLGQSTPVNQTIEFINAFKPNWVITYSIVKSKHDIEEFLDQISETNCDNVIYVENKHQAYLNIDYPNQVLKASNYKELLQITQ